MAPLCKRALRYLGLLKTYVVPRKSIAVFSCILIASLTVVGFVLLPETTHALFDLLEDAGSAIGSVILALTITLMQFLAKLCMQLAVFFLSFFIAIAKYNGYIDAPVVLLGWGMVRDVANMFFIVVLMVIAFATILGLESYAWKKTLGKFILMAILVNFSNLIFQLVIDITHVFTLTFANAIAATAGGNLIAIFNMDKMLSISEWSQVGTSGTSLILTTTFPASVMALTMATVSMMTIGLYCVIMLMRMVMLWVLMILSPLAFIMNILPQTKSYASNIWKELVSNATAGPVMVFFLWLAFAALGAGNAGPDMGSAPDGRQFGVSISEAATYENLSNFLIAIAFMWVGIKKVQETGVVGGGIASTATRFAGKVATIASGVALGQKLAGGLYRGGVDLGAKGLKAGAYRMPIVGGAKWKRAGAAVAGRLGVWSARRTEKRAQAAAERDREIAKGEDASGKKIGFFGKARRKLENFVYQPTERTDKIAEDWKDAVSRAQETMKENLGTSGTAAGQAKLTQTIRVNVQQQVGEVKKEQKRLERIDGLRKEWDGLSGSDEQKRAAIKAKHGKNVALAAHELFAKEGKIQKAVIKPKAKLEDIKQRQEREREIQVARARDDQQKTGTMYQDAVRANHVKQDDEKMSVGSWDRQAAYMDQLTKEISTEERIKIDGSIEVLTAEQIEENKKKLSSIVSYQLSTGSTMGGATVDKLAKQALFSAPIAAGNGKDALESQQAQVLSAILQEDVDPTKVADALDRLKTIHGDNFGAFMERLNTNLNKAGADGAPTYAGLFKEDFSGPEPEWKATDHSGDEDYVNAKRGYAQSRANFRTMTGLGGLAARKNVAGELTISIDSTDAQNNIAQAFSGVTANVANSIQQETIDDFQKLIAEGDIGKLNALFDKMRDMTDEAGLKAMFKRIDKTFKKNASGDDVATIVASLHPDNKSLFT